jgi:hypothetical protein
VPVPSATFFSVKNNTAVPALWLGTNNGFHAGGVSFSGVPRAALPSSS